MKERIRAIIEYAGITQVAFAKKLLAGAYAPESTIMVGVKDGKLAFE